MGLCLKTPTQRPIHSDLPAKSDFPIFKRRYHLETGPFLDSYRTEAHDFLHTLAEKAFILKILCELDTITGPAFWYTGIWFDMALNRQYEHWIADLAQLPIPCKVLLQRFFIRYVENLKSPFYYWDVLHISLPLSVVTRPLLFGLYYKVSSTKITSYGKASILVIFPIWVHLWNHLLRMLFILSAILHHSSSYVFESYSRAPPHNSIMTISCITRC